MGHRIEGLMISDNLHANVPRLSIIASFSDRLYASARKWPHEYSRATEAMESAKPTILVLSPRMAWDLDPVGGGALPRDNNSLLR
jgi:hypothetical protein